MMLTELTEIAERYPSGKAGALARLAADFPVPPFVVLEAPLGESADRVSGSIPSGLDEFVESAGGIVAVRSSASAEDSAHASFAGLFETVLGVTRTTLRAAIERVQRSLNAQRVSEYVAARGLDPEDLSMAVVVQQMVHAASAGVAFSRYDPVDDDVTIEAVHGLGDGLVSGRLTPDRYLYGRLSGAVSVASIAYQATYQAYHDGLVVSRVVPPADRNARKLTDSQVREVGLLALQVESAMDYVSADVEWAYGPGDSELFLLQARPYTGYSPKELEVTDGL